MKCVLGWARSAPLDRELSRKRGARVETVLAQSPQR